MSRLARTNKINARYAYPYYGGSAIAGTSQTPTVGRVYLAQFNVPNPGFSVDAILFTTNSVVAGNVIAGIYRAASTDTPDGGPLIVQSASTAVSGTINMTNAIPVAQTFLAPGTYYAAITFSDATCTFNRHASVDQGTNIAVRFASDPSFGALPATCSATSTFTPIPALRLRLV